MTHRVVFHYSAGRKLHVHHRHRSLQQQIARYSALIVFRHISPCVIARTESVDETVDLQCKNTAQQVKRERERRKRWGYIAGLPVCGIAYVTGKPYICPPQQTHTPPTNRTSCTAHTRWCCSGQFYCASTCVMQTAILIYCFCPSVYPSVRHVVELCPNEMRQRKFFDHLVGYNSRFLSPPPLQISQRNPRGGDVKYTRS